MPFRRSSSLRPIKSDKHEVVWSNLGQNASTVVNILLVKPVAAASQDTATEVGIGDKVNGIYLEFQFSAENISNTKIIHWQIFLFRLGQTFSVPSLYYQPDRSQVLKRGMEMLPKSVNTIIKRIVFVPIPKFASRMKQNQEIYLSYIASSAETINSCGFGIYKAYS